MMSLDAQAHAAAAFLERVAFERAEGRQRAASTAAQYARLPTMAAVRAYQSGLERSAIARAGRERQAIVGEMMDRELTHRIAALPFRRGERGGGGGSIESQGARPLLGLISPAAAAPPPPTQAQVQEEEDAALARALSAEDDGDAVLARQLAEEEGEWPPALSSFAQTVLPSRAHAGLEALTSSSGRFATASSGSSGSAPPLGRYGGEAAGRGVGMHPTTAQRRIVIIGAAPARAAAASPAARPGRGTAASAGRPTGSAGGSAAPGQGRKK
jgi:hypothetical protein